MKRLITVMMSIALATVAFSQDVKRDYLNAMFEKCGEYEARYYRELTPIADDLLQAQVTDLVGNVKMEGTYILDGKDLIEHGRFIFYYGSGQIESNGYYERGIKVGTWKRFTMMGDPRTDRYYNPESAAFLRSVMAGDIPNTGSK